MLPLLLFQRTPITLTVIVLLALFAIPAAAQTPQEPSPVETPTFTSGVSEVRLDVQVRQGKRLVPDLNREDFLIFDEQKPVQPRYFNRETEPLTLLLLLDISGSMRRYIDQMSKTAKEALKVLRPEDRVGIMVYARRSRLHFDFSSSFEEAAMRLRSAPDNDYVGAGTSTNDAVVAAASLLKQKAPAGRRAILLVTDNGGLNENLPDEKVLEALYAADTVLNSIAVGNARRPRPMHPDMNPDYTPTDVFKLAEESGGEALKVDRADESFRPMMERIRTRYAITYGAPPGIPGEFRKLVVELAPAAQKRLGGATVLARRGYYVR